MEEKTISVKNNFFVLLHADQRDIGDYFTTSRNLEFVKKKTSFIGSLQKVKSNQFSEISLEQ
jgi:hypothetical protein